jgi:hypothetical protein
MHGVIIPIIAAAFEAAVPGSGTSYFSAFDQVPAE